ncbi:glycerol kinase GlpK [Mucilaginibacter lappiensis]|uniref:Glycerol kinase n=1 Tax=Mucilaginibacter lappiensis TaxID=354630 RepID=A0A1N7CZC4_9SPHI|nr:glycerol kinase GlpK [Mucilaginibacter lappiensis]MBB6111082.1 glycerol kinase [Mucilaginibacter lappiensis]MBB6128793.1 glycerol kinase [Mucilaginibacter lappiensis]SIR68857.1 glycerol kinase [Mucilaginibacter lappiensis]
MEDYILALDQGTTSSRAIVFDHKGQIKSVAQKEFKQIFPQSGWVEHDPNEIWSTQASVAAEATVKMGINGTNLKAIGITNQRETTIVWDRNTGEPVYNAIVWQDRRTAAFCDKLKQDGHEDMIRSKTGLVIDAYFSGSKIRWILDNVEGARARAEKGELAFGTVDSWLVWKFTRGHVHITDVTNACRTMLFNIQTQQWDDELIALLDIPKSMLPEVKQSSEVYGETATTIFASKVPIAGIAGDQHAALFGQMCIEKAMVKNTYGTGCFMLMNIGDKFIESKNNLLTTIAWKINGKIQYAFEGSIFIGGAVVQWLRDGLGIIKTSADVEKLALAVEDTQGVYFVPAFAGLGAPYWKPDVRGTIVGLSRGTTASHIARAALESIAYQTMDVLKAMEADSGMEIKELRVDGGATANDLLMQFQSNLLNCKVIRPNVVETTALGAAYLAGLAVGYWKNVEEIQQLWKSEKEFTPEADLSEIKNGIKGWKKAIHAAQSWTDELPEA